MIVHTALTIAGPGSHVVARPTGVLHIYTGKLAPSGRHVPVAGRPVCRARTRRLRVVARGSWWQSADPRARLCARCSVCLTASLQVRQTEPASRGQQRARFGHLTPADVAGILIDPRTKDEADAGAYLSLLLFGHAGCLRTVTGPAGEEWPSLHDLTHKARGKFREPGAHELAFDQHVKNAAARRQAERAEVWQDREDRIARLGINNVKPLKHSR